MQGDPLVSVRNLRVSFRLDSHNVFDAVRGISFDIPRNATLALVGESGSGKSVTALAILGLLPPENSIVHPGSEVLYGGRNIAGLTQRELRKLRGADISMIFQEPMTSLNPVFTVGYQLEEVLRLHRGLAGKAARKRSIELLEEVGIPDASFKIDAFPSQMSGGQQQRVMIAMAIACEPKLLIADEPTTALDVTIQGQILYEIQKLTRETGTALIWITHDLSVIAGLADRVCVMYAGRIVEQGSCVEVLAHPAHPYTQGLLDSVPANHEPGQRLRQIPGMTPSLLDLPPGCPFRERCSYAKADCEVSPDMRPAGGPGQSVRCFHPLVPAHA
jgi:peptide/nickel transport system ATP-binding protein